MCNRGEDNLNSNFNCRKGEMLVRKVYILGYLTFKMFEKKRSSYLLFLQNAVIEAAAKLKWIFIENQLHDGLISIILYSLTYTKHCAR